MCANEAGRKNPNAGSEDEGKGVSALEDGNAQVAADMQYEASSGHEWE